MNAEMSDLYASVSLRYMGLEALGECQGEVLLIYGQCSMNLELHAIEEDKSYLVQGYLTELLIAIPQDQLRADRARQEWREKRLEAGAGEVKIYIHTMPAQITTFRASPIWNTLSCLHRLTITAPWQQYHENRRASIVINRNGSEYAFLHGKPSKHCFSVSSAPRPSFQSIAHLRDCDLVLDRIGRV